MRLAIFQPLQGFFSHLVKAPSLIVQKIKALAERFFDWLLGDIEEPLLLSGDETATVYGNGIDNSVLFSYPSPLFPDSQAPPSKKKSLIDKTLFYASREQKTEESAPPLSLKGPCIITNVPESNFHTLLKELHTKWSTLDEPVQIALYLLLEEYEKRHSKIDPQIAVQASTLATALKPTSHEQHLELHVALCGLLQPQWNKHPFDMLQRAIHQENMRLPVCRMIQTNLEKLANFSDKCTVRSTRALRALKDAIILLHRNILKPETMKAFENCIEGDTPQAQAIPFSKKRERFEFEMPKPIQEHRIPKESTKQSPKGNVIGATAHNPPVRLPKRHITQKNSTSTPAASQAPHPQTSHLPAESKKQKKLIREHIAQQALKRDSNASLPIATPHHRDTAASEIKPQAPTTASFKGAPAPSLHVQPQPPLISHNPPIRASSVSSSLSRSIPIVWQNTRQRLAPLVKQSTTKKQTETGNQPPSYSSATAASQTASTSTPAVPPKKEATPTAVAEKQKNAYHALLEKTFPDDQEKYENKENRPILREKILVGLERIQNGKREELRDALPKKQKDHFKNLWKMIHAKADIPNLKARQNALRVAQALGGDPFSTEESIKKRRRH